MRVSSYEGRVAVVIANATGLGRSLRKFELLLDDGTIGWMFCDNCIEVYDL